MGGKQPLECGGLPPLFAGSLLPAGRSKLRP